MTGNQLIAAALRRIGSLGQGEVPNASESQDAQLVWNSMLDSWNTDRGNLYTLAVFTGNLANGVQSYLMGTGQTLNAPRPVRIQTANVLIGSNRWPLDLIGGDEWASKIQRTAVNTLAYQLFEQYGMRGSQLDAARWAALLSTSTIIQAPWQLYCDYGSPNARLNFWPVPGGDLSLELQYWQVIAPISDLTKDLTTDLFFPPGYVEAMRLNLAFKLCEEWGTAMPATLPAEAQQALAAMRQINTQNAQIIEGTDTAGPIPKPTAPPAAA